MSWSVEQQKKDAISDKAKQIITEVIANLSQSEPGSVEILREIRRRFEEAFSGDLTVWHSSVDGKEYYSVKGVQGLTKMTIKIDNEVNPETETSVKRGVEMNLEEFLPSLIGDVLKFTLSFIEKNPGMKYRFEKILSKVGSETFTRFLDWLKNKDIKEPYEIHILLTGDIAIEYDLTSFIQARFSTQESYLKFQRLEVLNSQFSDNLALDLDSWFNMLEELGLDGSIKFLEEYLLIGDHANLNYLSGPRIPGKVSRYGALMHYREVKRNYIKLKKKRD